MTLDLDELGRIWKAYESQDPEGGYVELSDEDRALFQAAEKYWPAMIDRLRELEAEVEAATYDDKAKERLQSFRYWMARHKELEAENKQLREALEH